MKSNEKTYEKKYNVQIRRDAHMVEPLEKAAQDKGISANQLFILVMREWLMQNDYLLDPPASTEINE